MVLELTKIIKKDLMILLIVEVLITRADKIALTVLVIEEVLLIDKDIIEVEAEIETKGLEEVASLINHTVNPIIKDKIKIEETEDSMKETIKEIQEVIINQSITKEEIRVQEIHQTEAMREKIPFKEEVTQERDQAVQTIKETEIVMTTIE